MGTAYSKRGIYFTEDDVLIARRNIERLPRAQAAFERMKQRCESFLLLPDEFVYDSVLGMRDETFAYGISGCPGCGKAFPMEPEEQRRFISGLELHPVKTVTCPNCRTTFPNEQYPDDGQGFERNGKGYYPIGMWNFFHAGELLGGVRDHEGLVTKLTYMYMLTGDYRYAHKAIVLLDAFGAIIAGTIGPRDFTPFGSSFEIGRLHLLTSIVHRVKVFLAHDYSWLSDLAELDATSPALAKLGKQGSIRENIVSLLEEYMLTEPGGPEYDLRDGNLTNLQNHESDGVRAMLAVGLALGREDYCRWGVQAVEAYFYNAIGRDGMYYEGSYGYSLFTGTVFLDIAMLAMRASTEAQLVGFHPFACDRFYRFAVENPLRMMCQGHMPGYGDWGRDRSVGREPDGKLLTNIYRASQMFRQFSPSKELRAKAELVMRQLFPLIEEQLGGQGSDLFFSHPEGSAIETERFRLPAGNTLMADAGIVILRDRNDTTALLRFGPNQTHSHDDVLALHYYAYGQNITADLGYGIYGTNSHFGWASKSIAHNTVVVNRDERMVAQQIYKPFRGGRLTFLHESANVSAMEAQAPELYGIDVYQRMVGIVPIGRNASYAADFFAVFGAETADYAFHAFHSQSELRLAGTDRVADPAWTLAGVDEAEKGERQLYYDRPSCSYGERLTTGETFSEFMGDEKQHLWTPQVNNGYGYVYDLREHRTASGTFKATWRAQDGCELRLFGVGAAADRLFSGLCPSLDGDVRHPILVWRSRDARKTYGAVIQAASPDGEGEQAVLEVEQLEADQAQATAIAIRLSDGRTDYWVYSLSDGQVRVNTRHGEWMVDGRCAWMRIEPDGSIEAAELLQARQSVLAGVVLSTAAERAVAIVRAVDTANGTITVHTVRGSLPESGLIGIRSARTGRITVYEATRTSECELRLKESMTLSKGIVLRSDAEVLESRYPLPLAGDCAYAGAPSRFDGKTVQGAYGGRAVIRSVRALKLLEVDVIHPFAEREPFDIVDIEPGDEVRFMS
ncbi:heparinase II/III family protein [Paenibacillus thermoaerophilus]|uniref:Heparinase II/III family protein n=1 Tax=Paenibacillus thermoaerophilus TaxID=1215385 RepID=A0ABW2V650_9BACL|nr:heparinase II/III family protein [Paenibacillus thermoaerophilus]TMV12025.1 hypothetical protein FE781_12570 [Paenibacillus thermoaerophilus]